MVKTPLPRHTPTIVRVIHTRAPTPLPYRTRPTTCDMSRVTSAAARKCKGTFDETSSFLHGIFSHNIDSPDAFVRYVKMHPRLVPDNYRYGKNWKTACPQAINLTEEFIVRIAYELQSGNIRDSDILTAPTSLYAKKDTDGHHLRRVVLRRKIMEKEVEFVMNYYPWLLNILRCGK